MNVRLYETDLNVILSLHIPEERPYVLQRLFRVFTLQQQIQSPIRKIINHSGAK